VKEYLIKVVTEGQEDAEPLHSQLFGARSDDAAAEQARGLIRAHVSDPAQYGLLYVVDGPPAGALTRCSFLTDVEVD
jgi:hypothetical protein